MNSTLLKRLFRAIQSGSGGDVDTLCRKVIEDEKKAGHSRVAEELDRILSESRKTKGFGFEPTQGTLARLPTNRRDSAPLLQEVPRDQLRHHMVLPDTVHPADALFDPHRVPRHVEVDDDVAEL